MTATDADTQRRVLNRLRRARGQLDAVIRAVEEEQPCRAVVTQLAACSSALDRAGFTIISSAMQDCVNESEGSSDDRSMTIAELEKLFLSLS